MWKAVLLGLVCFYSSCEGEKRERINEPVKFEVDSTDEEILEVEDTSAFDTTIIFSGGLPFNYSLLTDTVAKTVLYKYAVSKGYLTSDDNLAVLSGDKLANEQVTYHKIHYLLSGGSGIVEYWLAPPLANGHCWQPHKALIANTKKGFAIVNPDILPISYNIDSIVNVDTQTVIFGYEYDCLAHKTIRLVRVLVR